MTRMTPRTVAKATAAAFALAMVVGVGIAVAAINPTSSGNFLVGAIDDNNPDGSVNGGALIQSPADGNPTAVSDTPLALFPLKGSAYTMLSTGDTTAADDDDSSESTSSDNNGGNGGHGGSVEDLVTLRVDLDVPASRNCLTIDYRFLTEEFDEFVGSDFNDAFIAELDTSDFMVQGDGGVIAPNNFAVGPDGQETTVNAAGTSADNALGTTYDGATPILRATTPISPGKHKVFLSIYDASDAIFDSTVFVDNLRLRNVNPDNCVLGAGDNPSESQTCQGQEPTVFPVGGIATGTAGDDVILGTAGTDVIRGRAGDDLICGRGGGDKLKGNLGDDSIQGGNGPDKVIGSKGNDNLKGNRGADKVRGGGGADKATGNKGTDRVLGGGGADNLRGNIASDILRGFSGNDVLRGNRGPDKLFGGPGNDKCRGGKGNDRSGGCER